MAYSDAKYQPENRVKKTYDIELKTAFFRGQFSVNCGCLTGDFRPGLRIWFEDGQLYEHDGDYYTLDDIEDMLDELEV